MPSIPNGRGYRGEGIAMWPLPIGGAFSFPPHSLSPASTHTHRQNLKERNEDVITKSKIIQTLNALLPQYRSVHCWRQRQAAGRVGGLPRSSPGSPEQSASDWCCAGCLHSVYKSEARLSLPQHSCERFLWDYSVNLTMKWKEEIKVF